MQTEMEASKTCQKTGMHQTISLHLLHPWLKKLCLSPQLIWLSWCMISREQINAFGSNTLEAVTPDSGPKGLQQMFAGFCLSSAYPVSNSISIWLCQGHEERRWLANMGFLGLFTSTTIHHTGEGPSEQNYTGSKTRVGLTLFSSVASCMYLWLMYALWLSQNYLWENLGTSVISGAQTAYFLRIVSCVSNYALGWQCMSPRKIWNDNNRSLAMLQHFVMAS